MAESLFNKFAGLSSEACNYIKKETLPQMFSCEFCEISKNTFFTDHIWTTGSVIAWNFTDICIVIVNTNFVAQRSI